jgi:hypothetical protein
MRAITINRPDQCTKLEIWQPRYSSAYTETKERVALLAQYKVAHGTSILLIEFTKAKHLAGLRYCINKERAMTAPIDSNGTIPCYAVPMSWFDTWDSGADVRRTANELFPEDEA